jgi:hypothetical protein
MPFGFADLVFEFVSDFFFRGLRFLPTQAAVELILVAGYMRTTPPARRLWKNG